jgi:hypothetical protein
MRLRQRERQRSADLGADLLQTAIFRSNLTTSLVPYVGAGGPTWSRATKAWGFNELGYLEELPSGCAFFGGARLVRNTVRTTSEDFSNAAWVKSNCTVTGTNVLVCSNSTADNSVNQATDVSAPTTAGQYFRYSIRAKRISGGVSFVQIGGSSTSFGATAFCTFSLVDGTYSAQAGVTANVAQISSDTYEFSVGLLCTVTTPSSDVFYVSMQNGLSDTRKQSFVGDGVKSFQLLRAWSVNVSQFDASYVPEYVSVGVVSSPYHGAGIDGAKYFGTDQNGLALGRDKLLGFRREAAATNNLLQSRNLTQNAWGSPVGGGVRSEILTNGTFAVSTDWTAEAAAYWSISGGSLNLNAPDGAAAYSSNSQTYGSLVTGKQYVVEFDYTHTSGSAPIPTLRGSDSKSIGSSTGRKTVTMTCGASVAGYGLRFQSFSACVATIDNITIKEAPVQCAQTATGLDGIANTATTLTATEADAIILQPTSGIASADRCASAYVKRRTGTGTISFTQDGGSTWTDITSQINSSTWSRVQITSTLANPSVGFKISTSGDEIDVDVVQNEAGSVATSPIVTTTATITRNSTSLTYQTASNIDLTVGTVYCGFKLDTSLYSGFPIACTADGRMIYSYLNDTRIANYDGVNVAYDTPPAYTSGRPLKIASAWGGATKSIGVDGRTPVASAFDGSMGSGATIDIGGGTSIGSAYIKSIAIYNYQMTDAQLQEVTK